MFCLLLITAVSLAVWLGSFYFNFTKAVPRAGGQYIEGIVGQPLYVNPLLSQTSEADSDLTQLIFSGLFKYDKDGNVVPDLVENFSVSEDQKTYTLNLKKDVTWHDGEPLKAQDVYFTYNVLQDPSYKSPIRQNLQGIEVVVNDDYSLTFNLKAPYVGFLENLTTGILPKHIWENIAPEKFALAEYNLHPIGSGPYIFSDFQKDSSGNILTFTMGSNKNYYDSIPYISKITFNFYPDDSALITAFNEKEVMGMGSIPPENIKDIKNLKSTNVNELVIPRYFSVFFNQNKSVVLANDEIRQALNMSVDRKQIIDVILHGKGVELSSPFFPQMKGFDQSLQIQTNIEEANKKLEEAGWKMEGEVRKKGDTEFVFELVTTDWPELNQTADLLKQQWAKIGAKVEIKVLSVSDLQQNYIKNREYDSLLFGQAISFNPDLYSFWHSSQKKDPGLNLSLFDNKDADSILENVRQQMDENARQEEFKKFQTILASEVPATFLYGRYYLFPTNTTLQGVETRNINNPQQRFVDVNKWYVKTKRILK